MKSHGPEKLIEDHDLWRRTHGKEGTRLDKALSKLSLASLVNMGFFNVEAPGAQANLSKALLPRKTDSLDD
jgi:hypothetical protein